MSKGLFVIGTGTDVGKTYAAALMVKKLHESGLSAGYYKAAVSGNDRQEDGSLLPGDPWQVKKLSGIDQPLEEMCPYVYQWAVSPHLAAQREGNPVELERVLEGFRQVCSRYDYVTMEGSGGVLCPLRFDQQQLWLPQVIQACGLGCLLVADAGLGTINHVGLTAFYLERQGIPLKAILFNRFQPGNPLHQDNRRMCEELTGVPVVACLRQGERDLDLPAEALAALYE